MLWPLVLPFELTCGLWLTLILLAPLAAPKLKTTRSNAFMACSLLGVLLFVPSCMGIQTILDGIRFGRFEFPTYSDVSDHRAQRYLPPSAVKISMNIYPNGYDARYSISEANFKSYLDGLWSQYGKNSAVERGGFSDEGKAAEDYDFERFRKLGWARLPNAIKFYSPTERDGGGATYLFDAGTGVVYQRTGHW